MSDHYPNVPSASYVHFDLDSPTFRKDSLHSVKLNGLRSIYLFLKNENGGTGISTAGFKKMTIKRTMADLAHVAATRLVWQRLAMSGNGASSYG